MIEIKAGPGLDLAVSAVAYNTFYHQRRADECPHYSTDLNATFAAAEKVGLFKEYMLGQDENHGDEWFLFADDLTAFAVGPTPALAICAAILKLREPEEEEVENDAVSQVFQDGEATPG